jgi:hypothetical protein
LEPWELLSVERLDDGHGFVDELRAELGPGHALFAVRDHARPVAIRIDCEDVLFWLGEDDGRFAVVHLTWTNHTEPEPCPATSFVASLEDFVAEIMIPDHRTRVEAVQAD